MFYILAGAVEIYSSCVYGCFLPTARNMFVISQDSSHAVTSLLHSSRDIWISRMLRVWGYSLTSMHTLCPFQFASKHWHSTFLCKTFKWPEFYIPSLVGFVSSLGSRISCLSGSIYTLLHSLFVFHVRLLWYVIIYLPSVIYLPSRWGLFLSTCFQLLVLTKLPLCFKRLI